MARRWGEGTIDRLPNGRARVRWRENGVRRSEAFPSYQLAEAFRRGRIGDLARGRAGIERAPRQFPVLDEHPRAWLERREHTHRAWMDDRGRWENHLSPVFRRCARPTSTWRRSGPSPSGSGALA